MSRCDKKWNVFETITRCKTITDDSENKTKLARVLTLIELVFLGIGTTLGLGVYVIAGSVAKTTAGPAVIISFLIAAVVTVMGAVCFAEIASKIPTAGSSYVYSYASLGEFYAFTLGWFTIFGGIIGSATLVKGISNYIDSLLGNVYKNFMIEHMTMNVSIFSEYPDFFALFLMFTASSLTALGVRSSVRLSNILTILNIITIIVIIIAGSTKINIDNWKIPIDNVTDEYRPNAGSGGFMPFGFHGVILGVSRCFFGFAGFEIISTTGEEAKKPKRNIPLAIGLTMLVVILVYFSISSVTTLMWPYYLQDANAPFPHVFEQLEMPIVKWIVTIGAIFAMSTSLIGTVFSLPRIIYAMASDGILFKRLATVNSWTKTPVIAIMSTGIIAGISAALFNIEQLIDMVAPLPLLNYTIVAISVLVLRYKNVSRTNNNETELEFTDQRTLTPLTMSKHLFNLHGIKQPTGLSCRIAKVALSMFVIMTLGFSISIVWAENGIIKYFAISIFGLLGIVFWLIIIRQPMYDTDNFKIKVPFITIVVCLIVIINTFLMIQINYIAWIKNTVWFIIGVVIYFTYGVKNSLEKTIRETTSNSKNEEKVVTRF